MKEISVSEEDFGCSSSVRNDGLIARMLLCERRRFDFTHVSAGEQLSVVLAPALPCWRFASATMIVRVHELDIDGDAEVEIRTAHASPSSDAPGTEFLATPPAARIIIKSDASPGELRLRPLAGSLGTHLHIAVEGRQAAVDAVSAAVTLTVELLLRRTTAPTSIVGLPEGTTNESIVHYDEAAGLWVENPSVRATATGALSIDGDLATGGSVNVGGNLLAAGAQTVSLVASDDPAEGVRLATGLHTPLRTFTFSGAVIVPASTLGALDLITDADNITAPNTGAFVSLEGVARWGTDTVTRAGLHYRRFFSRTTGSAFSTLLNLVSHSVGSDIIFYAPTGAMTDRVRVLLENSSSSAITVHLAFSVTLQSTEPPPS